MAINPETHNPFDPDVVQPTDVKPQAAYFTASSSRADFQGMIAKAGEGWNAGIAALNTGVLTTYPQPTEQNFPITPTPDTLIPSTRQTISTANGSVEVCKFNDGQQEMWVAMAPMEDGTGSKTYKLDIDPSKNELSETEKEQIKRMIDNGYFGKLEPESAPSSTPVVHKEGEPFDFRPYKGYGLTYQVLNQGAYELWYVPNDAGENQLVWQSNRPLDLSKDLKPLSPLADKLEQIAAPRTSAPVPPLLFSDS